MKIGMIQMDAAAGHMEHNIAHGFELMEEAAEHSDLVVMPELWTMTWTRKPYRKKIPCCRRSEIWRGHLASH